MTRDPEPPVNVRVIDTTGHEWPVQVVHAGRMHGLDVWDVVDQPAHITPARVLVETLPAKTTLRIALPADDDEEAR